MKVIRYFAMIAIILSVTSSYCQSIEEEPIYYQYELFPSGEISEQGDTIYEVFFTLNNKDIIGMKTLIVMNDTKEKEISLDAETINKDTRFEKQEEGLRIALDGWSGYLDWIVTGIREDNSQVSLKWIDADSQGSVRVINSIIIPKIRTRPPEKTKIKEQL